MGWFLHRDDIIDITDLFSSPLRDGLVREIGEQFEISTQFSSPLGDGLVRGKMIANSKWSEGFSSPLGDGLVLIEVGTNIRNEAFSSPLGDGLVHISHLG